MAAAGSGLAHADLTEYLASLSRQLPDEASVMDRAFALGVGTRELYDTIRDTDKTLELYAALGSSNIKVSAWQRHKLDVTLDPSRMPLSKDKSEAVKLPHAGFAIFQRLVQRYRSDGQGVPYLVSSVEYLCLFNEEVAVPRLFVLFRISQTPTQQYGEIMQLHEYLTFYRGEQLRRDTDTAQTQLATLRASPCSSPSGSSRPSALPPPTIGHLQLTPHPSPLAPRPSPLSTPCCSWPNRPSWRHRAGKEPVLVG